ncbi:MAG: hypothetical protein Q9169_006912 [Polycauliona sp. 2 TL-2023]
MMVYCVNGDPVWSEPCENEDVDAQQLDTMERLALAKKMECFAEYDLDEVKVMANAAAVRDGKNKIEGTRYLSDQAYTSKVDAKGVESTAGKDYQDSSHGDNDQATSRESNSTNATMNYSEAHEKADAKWRRRFSDFFKLLGVFALIDYSCFDRTVRELNGDVIEVLNPFQYALCLVSWHPMESLRKSARAKAARRVEDMNEIMRLKGQTASGLSDKTTMPRKEFKAESDAKARREQQEREPKCLLAYWIKSYLVLAKKCLERFPNQTQLEKIEWMELIKKMEGNLDKAEEQARIAEEKDKIIESDSPSTFLPRSLFVGRPSFRTCTSKGTKSELKEVLGDGSINTHEESRAQVAHGVSRANTLTAEEIKAVMEAEVHRICQAHFQAVDSRLEAVVERIILRRAKVLFGAVISAALGCYLVIDIYRVCKFYRKEEPDTRSAWGKR